MIIAAMSSKLVRSMSGPTGFPAAISPSRFLSSLRASDSFLE